MNKLKELENQYKEIKPPQNHVSNGISFLVKKDGVLAITSINGNGSLNFDSDQVQVLFEYLKNELRFE